MEKTKIDKLISDLENNGKGCKCSAYYSGECACGANWPDHHIHEAIEQLKFLKRLEELSSDLKYSSEFIGKVVRSHFDNFN